MLRRAVLTSLSLLVACSPACSPAPAPSTPNTVVAPPPTKPPPPEQTHARWLSADAIGAPVAQLELGDKGVLQVGAGGRRWRLGKDGAVEASSFLLSSDLVDVRRAGDKVLLLGADGVVYLADDPLGPAKATRPSPSRTAHYAALQGALLGVEDDGTLHRSTDGGLTWKKSSVPVGSRRVVGLVGNVRGSALLLSHPQKVFVSLDDGATFADLVTPGIGGTSVERDANGELYLRSSLLEKDAKLLTSPTRLEVATGFTALKTPEASKPKNEPRKQLIGARLVAIHEEVDPTSKRRKIAINVQPLAGAETPTYVLAPSASPVARVHLAGHENIVVAGVYDPDAEPRGIKLFRTLDDGKNWEPLGAVEGTEGAGFRLGVAPNVVIVGTTCPVTPPCVAPRMKIGSKDWQPLGVSVTARVGAVAYDAPRDRLLVLAVEESSYTLYAGKRGDTLKKLEYTLGSGAPRATTVDDEGTLRVAYGSPWRIVKLGHDLKTHATSYLPFAPRGLDLAGSRGFAWSDDAAWETADGGDHWAKVPMGGSGAVACSAAGCLQHTAVRVGWDLPSPGATLIASTATPLDSATKDKPVPPATPLKLACQTSGKWTSHPGSMPSTYEPPYDGDVRFTGWTHDQESGALRSVTLARGTAAPTVVTLLGATPKESANRTYRHWFEHTPAGMIALRYSFSTIPPKDPGPDGTKRYNPVDVEIAWYTAATGKTQRVSLPQVKPFRVGRSTPSAVAEIGDAGLLFLAGSGESPLYLIGNNGKVQTVPRPTGLTTLPFGRAVRNGNQLVLAQASNDTTVLTLSNDLGKTWTSTVWTTGETSELISFQGKPTLIVGAPPFDGGGSSGMIAFETLTPDPPASTRFMQPVVAFGDKGAIACNKPGASINATYQEQQRHVGLVVTGEKAPLTLTVESTTMLGMPDGSTCTQSFGATAAEDKFEYVARVFPADLTHGWLFRRTDYDKFEARPLSCTLQ